MTPADKIKNATPVMVKPVPNDPDRLHMSRADVIKKANLRKEIEAKLELERVRLEAEYEKQNEELENLGKAELDKSFKKKSVKKDIEEE